MSLGIAFKGPEGIVLAADSRVTLNSQVQIPQGPQGPISMLLPSTFDNATKLLKVKGQDYVGAVTYGLGAIGQQEPRTAHSFMPEFEASLGTQNRLSVEDFAKRLSDFFMAQWTTMAMPIPVAPGQDMVFLIGGYDANAVYGRIFEIYVPSKPDPHELIPIGQFGAAWGGQREITDRLINGFDARAPQLTRNFLHAPPLGAGQPDPLDGYLKAELSAKIPWQFLPLQDCVDLAIFLVRATITLQKWVIDIRGVGGAIDVATVTREGFHYIQQKEIAGETR